MKSILSKIAFTMLLLGVLSPGLLSAQVDAPLPEFQFKKADETLLTKESLTPFKPVVVVYFDPDCDHCQKQATWISERQKRDQAFSNINLVFVSWSTSENNTKFRQTYFPDMGDNLHFGIDHDYQIDTWFGYSEVPSVFVYGRDWKLNKKFTKEVSADEILEEANK